MPENVDAFHSIILADRRTVSQKVSRDWGTCRIHHVLDEETLCQIGATSDVWSCCGFTGNSGTLLTEHDRFLRSTCDNERNLDIFVRSRDKRTIYVVEAQWFTTSTKFRKQKSTSKVMAPVFSDKDGILLVDCLDMGTTTHLSWTKWSCQQQCCLSRTTPPDTRLSIHSGSWLICTLKC
jgi:hypothetical protein